MKLLLQRVKSSCMNICFSYWTKYGTWEAFKDEASIFPSSIRKILLKDNCINGAEEVSWKADEAVYLGWREGEREESRKYEETILVDAIVGEICPSTRLLYLSSDRLHPASKHVLKNGVIKGDDKYTRTFTNPIKLIQYYNLQESHPNERQYEASLTQNVENNKRGGSLSGFIKYISNICRQF